MNDGKLFNPIKEKRTHFVSMFINDFVGVFKNHDFCSILCICFSDNLGLMWNFI